MPMMEVEVNADEAKREIQMALAELPRVEEEIAEEMMEEAVDEVRNSAEMRFNDFRGNLRRQISMDNVTRSDTDGGKKLTLRLEGKSRSGADYIAWNEFAQEGHYVPVDEDHPTLQKWVDENYDYGDNPDFLFVQPKPFVKPVLPRIRNRLKNKVENDNNSVTEFVDSMQR